MYKYIDAAMINIVDSLELMATQRSTRRAELNLIGYTVLPQPKGM